MKQSEALDILKMGHNVYLTGEPGSGKTFVLNKFIEYLRANSIPVGVTASTGIAATHISGSTIHSWCGIGIHDDLSDDYIDKLTSKSSLKKRLESAKVLIIDEVSMLHGQRLDLVNKVCRAFKKVDRPFGGLQVVLSGDLFQLPPVTKGRLGQDIDFIFKSRSWKELDLKICYLSEQHRQDDDQLLSILSKIRKNEASYPELDILQGRQIDEYETNHTRLYTHNVDVDAVNMDRLAQISDESVVLSAVTSGNKMAVEALKKSCLAPEQLELKIGAEVMCVANNPAQRFVNGSRGIVIGFNEITSAPIIKLRDTNRKITLERHTWSINEGDKTIAELAQYPIRLAWAITIHKSQGMSLDGAEIDLGRSFEPGMGYVALSRLRTLDGLLLRGINELALQVHPEVLDFDKSLIKLSIGAQSSLSRYDSAVIEKRHSDVIEKISSKHFAFDESLFSQLKNWRTSVAKKAEIPPYLVFSDKTLKEISRAKPLDEDDLQKIPGIGPKKLEQYGEAVLAIIATKNS